MAPHGTGSMLRGVGKVLRARSPQTRICLVEQDSRPHPEYEAAVGPHPSWPSHLLRGWTTDFAPTAVASGSTARFVDEFVPVRGHEAIETARALARHEGLFTGISGGALAAGALRVAKAAPAGSCVLTVLLDTSLVHLGTPLVDGVSSEMSDDERRLLTSAPKATAAASGWRTFREG